MKEVYRFADYKKYLDYRTNVVGERGIVTKMAEAAGCQRSYLSKVINAEVHLTPDQAFRLCRFWNFSPEEKDYFMLLVEHDRAADHEYRNNLKLKMKKLKQYFEDLANRVGREKITASTENFLLHYYSHWAPAAIHMLTSIPKFQTASAIAHRLQLPLLLVEQHLQLLAEHEYIKKQNDLWVFSSGENHLSKESSLLSFHLNNWRNRALQMSQLKDPDEVHFSVVQSLSLVDFEKLKSMILEFIDQYAEVANPSDPEELANLNIDFYKV